MVDIIVFYLSWACLVTGSLLGIIGAIGLFRFPDFYSRIHAASVTDTLCAGLIIAGLVLQGEGIHLKIKLILILLILTYAAPTASHALAKSAMRGRLRPMSAEDIQKKLKKGEEK